MENTNNHKTMIMKPINLLTLSAIIIMLASIVSCDNSKKQLEKAVERENVQCPYPVPVGMCTSVTLEDDYVVCKVIFDERENGSFDAIRNHWIVLKQSIICNLRTPNDGTQTMLKMLKSTKTGLRYLYTGSKSGERLNIEFSPSEIDSCLKNAMSFSESRKECISYEITLSNYQCPQDIGDGLTIDSLSVEKDALVYNISFDGGQGYIENLKANYEQVKADIKQGFNDVDFQTKSFMSYCNDAGLKFLNYRYTDDVTGKSMIVSFTISEVWHTMANN